MIGLNQLGTAITVIIAVTLTALLVEIMYVLWRRHSSCRRSESDLARDAVCVPSNLLHFLCCKNKCRVEPQESSLPSSSSSSSPPELEQQVMKWQCLYGPSRVLFTIKEEEREGLDSECYSSAESVVKTKRACCFSEFVGVAGTLATEFDEVAVTIELSETTPFSTPCASPPYYTPSSSPNRGDGVCDKGLLTQSTPEKDVSPG